MDASRPVWEYQVSALTGDLGPACNLAGDEGWEIVQLLPQPGGALHALMKRHKRLVEPATPEHMKRLFLLNPNGGINGGSHA